VNAVADGQKIIGNANIGIQDVHKSTINIVQYIGKSTEFKNLEDRLKELLELFDAIPENKTEKRLEVSKKIEKQKQYIEFFRQDVLRLARTFQNVAIDTERLRQAKQHFEAGEFNQANAILNVDKLHAEQKSLLAKKEVNQKEVASLNKQLRHNAAEYLVKAQVTALDYSNKNRFEDTRKYYESSIRSFPFFNNLINFAYFLQTHNQFNEAEPIYCCIILNLRDELSKDDLAIILNNLAVLHKNKNDFVNAEKELKATLAIYQALAKTNSETYLPYVAMTLANLANLHLAKNDFIIAEKEYKKAVKIQKILAETDPETYLPAIATTLNNLAILHKNRNGFVKAEKEYNEALLIQKSLAKINPETFLPEVAGTLNNRGVLHFAKNDFEEAENNYNEALDIFRGLDKANPEAYLPNVAGTLNNLAVLHSVKENFEKAEIEYKEALKIRRYFAKTNPEAFLPDIATTQNNLANIHMDKNEFVEAEQEFKEALKIRRHLSKTSPEAFLPDVARTLNNLAKLNLANSEFGQAEMKFREALKIQRRLVKADPKANLPDLSMTLNNLADLHSKKNDLVKAEKEIKEALEIRRSLAKTNPEVFTPDLAITLVNISLFYLQDLPDKKKSITFACELIQLLHIFSKKTPDTIRYFTTAINVLGAWGFDSEYLDILGNSSNTLKKNTAPR